MDDEGSRLLMIGFDGIGFHAIGEQIDFVLPSLVYEPVSRATGDFTSLHFKSRDDYPVPITPTGDDILWDDDTQILWDDDSVIIWDD